MSGDFDVNSLEGSGLKHSPSEEYIRDEVIKDVLLNGLRADPSTCNEAQLRFVVQQKTSKKNQWNHTKKELLKWVHRNMSEIKREDIELIVQDPELDPDDLPEESDEEGSEFGEDEKEFSGLNDPSGVSGNELGSDTHGESTNQSNNNNNSSKNNITSKNNDTSTKVNQKSSSDRKTSDGKPHKKEKSSIFKIFSFNTSTSKNTQNTNNNSNSKDMKFDDTSNSNDQDANSAEAKDQSKSFTDQDSEFSVQKSPEERLSLLQQRLERLEASYLEELESIKNEMSALSKIIITNSNSNSNTNQSSTEQEAQEKSIAEETFNKKPSTSHTKEKDTKESPSRSSIIVEEDNKKKLRSTSLSHSARATPVSVNDDVACSSQSVSVLPSISQK